MFLRQKCSSQTCLCVWHAPVRNHFLESPTWGGTGTQTPQWSTEGPLRCRPHCPQGPHPGLSQPRPLKHGGGERRAPLCAKECETTLGQSVVILRQQEVSKRLLSGCCPGVSLQNKQVLGSLTHLVRHQPWASPAVAGAQSCYRGRKGQPPFLLSESCRGGAALPLPGEQVRPGDWGWDLLPSPWSRDLHVRLRQLGMWGSGHPAPCEQRHP